MHLDSSALVALLRDEPGAPEVEDALRAGGCLVTALTIAEVYDVALRDPSVDLDGLDARFAALLSEPAALRLAPLDRAAGRLAGVLRSRWWTKASPVSLADCFGVAASVLGRTPLMTADQSQADVAWAEGGEVRPVPNSRGVRPARRGGASS